MDTSVRGSYYIGLSTWTHRYVPVGTSGSVCGHIGPWTNRHGVDTSVRASWYIGLNTWTHWCVDKSAQRGHTGPCKLVHQAQYVDTSVYGPHRADSILRTSLHVKMREKSEFKRRYCEVPQAELQSTLPRTSQLHRRPNGIKMG